MGIPSGKSFFWCSTLLIIKKIWVDVSVLWAGGSFGDWSRWEEISKISNSLLKSFILSLYFFFCCWFVKLQTHWLWSNLFLTNRDISLPSFHSASPGAAYCVGETNVHSLFEIAAACKMPLLKKNVFGAIDFFFSQFTYGAGRAPLNSSWDILFSVDSTW